LIGLGVATVAVAAVVFLSLARPAMAPQDNPELMAKASKYAAEVQATLDANNKAAEDAKRVLITFPKDRPMRVLFAGDSLTSGYFSSTEDKGFSQIIAAELSKRGPIEQTRGQKAGGNLSTVGNLVDVPPNLDLAVVELGTNDTQGRTVPTAFAPQYDGLLTKITAASPDVKLICVGTWGAPGGDTDPYDSAIQAACDKRGGKYVDLSDQFMLPTHRGPAGVKVWAGTSDTFHPNDAGHRVIADMILDRIRFS
jgi:lysophospholipase L1-like esterase